MKLNIEYNKGIVFVRIVGSLDKNNCYRINKYLVPLINYNRIKYLVYNLYEVSNIDEEGLKAINNCDEAVRKNKGISCVCEIPDNYRILFDGKKIIKTKNELTALKLLEI